MYRIHEMPQCQEIIDANRANHGLKATVIEEPVTSTPLSNKPKPRRKDKDQRSTTTCTKAAQRQIR